MKSLSVFKKPHWTIRYNGFTLAFVAVMATQIIGEWLNSDLLQGDTVFFMLVGFGAGSFYQFLSSDAHREIDRQLERNIALENEE